MEPTIGLSPLARGTPNRFIRRFIKWRFIPAGAGNSLASSSNPMSQTVYPRWRGELSAIRQNVGLQIGLSPLARGTPEYPRLAEYLRRFIPAGAGNSGGELGTSRTETVYPRWCGELVNDWHHIREFVGLSPLARGTPVSVASIRALLRFIPAGAGNSKQAGFNPFVISVYPRWRGELPSPI
ncbi:Domain of uncharacterised function (DUF2825) [Salmonella enterica]|nr:Domain of uncharacterised function (DUF2825) [Salmonella enterica]